MALRPDPEAGRAAVLRMNLSHLEEVAEEAALKCVETKRKMNRVVPKRIDERLSRGGGGGGGTAAVIVRGDFENGKLLAAPRVRRSRGM